ncbi:hypothetical protein ONA91_25605 [Micromonospora sp. DR5-3]|uniref:hypothetical protein n=1 Tax=unclassified Micromonospora TaxID=2617518 RepID=UPI0011D8FA8D|nr:MULTISPECIES: hypothetical protein [unclassified Micromonospora]MCW3817831.1 hypothetical protein [Micromonospora sp. DR5-3]TYC21924.1 hypothetical protein FXF52_23165 [Micromonospora sp. MP36]
MTTYDGHLDPADPKPESLEELANEVSELADKIVAARLGNGELARRREWLKQAAAEKPIPSDVTCSSNIGNQASLPIVALSRESRNFNWPTAQYTMTARREAASIRAQARKDAEEYRDAALRRAADTIAQARAEAQKILEEARQEADRILGEAKEEEQRLNTAARHASSTRNEALEGLCAADRFTSIARKAVIEACVESRIEAFAGGAALLCRSENVETFGRLVRLYRSQSPAAPRWSGPLRLEGMLYEQATRAVAPRQQLEVECSDAINAQGVGARMPLVVVGAVRYALLIHHSALAGSSGGRLIVEAIEAKTSPRCLNTDALPACRNEPARKVSQESHDSATYLPAGSYTDDAFNASHWQGRSAFTLLQFTSYR